MEFSRPEYQCGLSLLQEIFPTQGSNPGLPHCRWILYQLSHKGSPKIPMGSLSLLQWIFPTQELNQGLLQDSSPAELLKCRQNISWQMEDKEIRSLKESGMLEWIHFEKLEGLLDDYVPLKHNLYIFDKGHREYTCEKCTSIDIKFIGGSSLRPGLIVKEVLMELSLLMAVKMIGPSCNRGHVAALLSVFL